MFKTLTFGAGVGVGTAAYYWMKKTYPATPNLYSAVAGAALIGASAFGVLAKFPIPEAVEEVMLGAGYALVGVSAITAALNPGATGVVRLNRMQAPMGVNRMMRSVPPQQYIYPAGPIYDTPNVY